LLVQMRHITQDTEDGDACIMGFMQMFCIMVCLKF
jgi:hypothetical protein